MELPEYEQMFRLEEWHWWFVSRRRLAIELIKRWTESSSCSRILDVGCGSGGNLKSLGQWGPVIGLDVSPLPLDLARRRRSPRLVQASGLALPYPNATFDLVTAFDVLYHRWVSDDQSFIGELYRVLRPGGWLLVTDSALPALWSAHDEIYYARQRYTLSDMREKLSRVGLQPCFCSYANMLLLPITMAIRLLQRPFPATGSLELRPPPKWLNQLLIATRDLELSWLRRGGVLPAGSSLICLSQKPYSTE